MWSKVKNWWLDAVFKVVSWFLIRYLSMAHTPKTLDTLLQWSDLTTKLLQSRYSAYLYHDQTFSFPNPNVARLTDAMTNTGEVGLIKRTMDVTKPKSVSNVQPITTPISTHQYPGPVIICPGCKCEDDCFCGCDQCVETTKLRHPERYSHLLSYTDLVAKKVEERMNYDAFITDKLSSWDPAVLATYETATTTSEPKPTKPKKSNRKSSPATPKPIRGKVSKKAAKKSRAKAKKRSNSDIYRSR